MIAKDRITSGVRAPFTAFEHDDGQMLLVMPRFTRWLASVLTIFSGSELLQAVHHRDDA